MIHYIVQMVVFQLLFLVIYDVFLKKETFFNWNRAYLLITPIISFVLPFIKINAIRETIPSEYIIALPEVLIGNTISESVLEQRALREVVISGAEIAPAIPWMTIIWLSGVGISIALFVYKIVKIQRLKRAGNSHHKDGVSLVTLPNTDTAFSFFNTIFLGETLSERQRENILLHESIHVKERHSLDMLFFEILRIVCWFNPLVYVYQNKMMMLQEYTADAKVVSQKDKKEYYQGLLSHVFQIENISFVNPFFNHSIIKKRIVMLQKTKSKQILKVKYLFLLPALFSILVYTACTDASAKGTGYNTSDSEIIQNIEILKNSIAKQGELSEEEERALKVLTAVTSNDKDILKDGTYDDVLNDLDIPFGVVDQVPTFKECSGSKEEIKKCTTQKMSEYVGKEFNANLPKELGLTGVKRVVAVFKIDVTGNIVDVRARGGHPKLEEEAIRVMKTLPQMIPGKHEGKLVSVLYNLPITFKVEK
ncbi:M56 family metallopeptidase [Dokdonia sp.]|uniref:M56 family metallopeptidase n=1 Tax=Dokdonia sp. TaxID=2024995 RepID=UPI00326667D3